MSKKWDFYIANQWCVSFNKSGHGNTRRSPNCSHPIFLRVSIRLQDPNEGGAPQASEFDILDNIEERVVVMLSKKLNTIHVGTITTART